MKDMNSRHNGALSSLPQSKEPLLNAPPVVVILIMFCFIIYFIPWYFFSSQLYAKSFVFFSFIPAFFKDDPSAFFYTAVSYSFVHGSFGHIAINMVWLLAFGSPLAKRFGTLLFLFFWVFTAVISALTYFAFHQDSLMPLVGASGAISGMMGAVARYDFSHGYFSFDKQSGGGVGSLQPIRKALCSRTVPVYISAWLIVNFITATLPPLFGEEGALIAWEAHVGGFISGFLLIGFFDTLLRKLKIII
ncbi:putative membrane protein, rhomboid family [Bartonella australis AUST/NH1]|uniref:Putative membrane protein, rhomboid family n=1 Tax=Bartonella australis (strain Aust/NH1) TaxID=1094489 RepID=M1N3A5_BARAA|nr:rhomboid family intramembrane serine protease [Bartonella australis]AGF74399.1 putative membrane protein, rhomboid family [Bartonella australis AUST/NH1]